MISLATPERAWGTAFGIHRTLDATGALLGPLAAFAILAALPGAFDTVFLLSVGFGLLGFAVIMTWVQNPAVVAPAPPSSATQLRTAAVLRAHWNNVGFRRIMLLGAAFGLFSIGDAFAYLVIFEAAKSESTIGLSGFGIEWFPLLFAGTAIGFLATATPLGRVADRVGRARVWVGGHVLLALVYVVLLFQPTSLLAIIAVLALLGVYYGATDGVLPALAAGVIPDHQRSGGLALLATVVAVARMIAAGSFGLIWGWVGVDRALAIMLTGLVLTIFVVSFAAVVRENTTEADR